MKSHIGLKTQTEVLEILNLADTKWNRQRLTYWRLGRNQTQRKCANVYKYKVRPTLIFKIHWIRNKSGKIYYSDAGVKLLSKLLTNKLDDLTESTSK